MSPRSPSWLPLVIVAALLLQALTPVLPAPTLAHAAEATPSNASVLGQPKLLNLRAWLITFGAHILISASTSALIATFDSPLPTPTPDPLGARLPVFDSPLPTPAPEPHLTLRLGADPAWVELGQSVTFTLTAENTGNAGLPALTLTNMLPEGLLYAAQSAVGFSYDPPARRLTWAAGELAAGAVITGSFQARVQDRALGETITTTVTASSPALAAPVTANADVETAPPRNNETWATPGEGGLLRSTDDRVLLRIPPAAVQERVKFVYTAQPTVPDPPAGLRFAFQVKAQAEDGQAVTFLAAPLGLTWAARPAEALGAGERLTLYAYDETAQQWRRLPTRPKPGDARQAQATTAQVTLFAVTAESSFVPEVMPSIRGVQNDLFTGSASLASPITLPPGRGGLTPNLALQFNSLSRQGDAGNASVLGTGWKLSADSFVYGTPFIAGSGPNTWRLAGAAYTEAGNDSTGWYLREAPQWRIVKPAGGNGALDAYAPDGTRYHFEPALHDWWNSGANARTDKWALQYVRDPLGNQIDYVYDSALPVDPVDVRNHWSNYADALGPRYRYFDDGDFGVHYLAQINLKQIRYNGGQTVVEFAHAARDDAPEPFCQPGNPAADPEIWGHFTTRLLTGIRVRQGGQLVAGYKLSYDHWGPTYCAADRRYALQMIARCSDEGLTNCLPPQTFTNNMAYNNGYLERFANGYGGQVAFGYGADGVVATRTVTDLVTGTANQWSYNYTDKLYDGWNVVGYAKATETLPSSLGAGNTIYHHFINGNGVDAGFRGKEDQQIVTVAGVKQQEVTRVWAGTTAGVYGGGKLVYLSEERQLTYDKDGQNPLARKTSYFYDLDHQGNAQYGNLTRSKDYSDDGVTLDRTTERWFYPRVDLANGKYIVNRLAQAKLWDGANVCQGQTRQIYDTTGFNQQQAPPTQGLLNEVWQARVCDSASQTDWVRPALHGYNSYGNPTSTTAANGAVTSTSYDTTFGTYPLSVTETPGPGGGTTLTTSYAYYGINPETGGSGLKGQLQKETNPNAAATRTSYDAWGRALELRQPGAAFTNPATEQLAYTDAAPYIVKHALRDDTNGDTSSTATYLDAWTFYDGLGQVLQTQAEGATNSQSVVGIARFLSAPGNTVVVYPESIGSEQ